MRYNLHTAGAICDSCGKTYIKRLVHVPVPLTVDRCSCDGYLRYRQLGWTKYTRWMLAGATYIEVASA